MSSPPPFLSCPFHTRTLEPRSHWRDMLVRSGAVRSARGQRQLAQGILRPAIVLYDENHPSGDLIGSLQSHDLTKQPDLLLVLGTSLKVHGLKRVVKEFARAVHELSVTKARPDGGKGRVVFVNKTPPGKEWEGVFDAWVEGDCDEFVDGVEAEWKRVKKGDWEEQGKLVLGSSAKTVPGGAKIVKGASTAAGAKKGKASSRESHAYTFSICSPRTLTHSGSQVPPRLVPHDQAHLHRASSRCLRYRRLPLPHLSPCCRPPLDLTILPRSSSPDRPTSRRASPLLHPLRPSRTEVSSRPRRSRSSRLRARPLEGSSRTTRATRSSTRASP